MAPQQQQPAQGLPPGAVRLQRVQIMDPSGFEKPMVAATVFVPVGWQAQGGVVWNVQGRGCGNGYTFNWSAKSLDGSTGASIFPGTSWAYDNIGTPPQPGCPTIRATNVHDYLQWLVQTYHPEARVLDYRPRPDLLKGYEQLNQVTPTALGQYKTWVEAGEILFGYNNNGRDMRESAAAVVIFTDSHMQSAGANMESFSASALPGYGFFAPDGQLNFKLSETIRSSIQLANDWQARINNVNSQNASVAARETAKRSQIISQTGDDIREMSMQSWENNNRVEDHVSRENSETIRGVETYTDPQSTTGTVELSSQYNDAYRLNDGSYVLTDDPSFNPYLATGQDGSKLEPTP